MFEAIFQAIFTIIEIILQFIVGIFVKSSEGKSGVIKVPKRARILIVNLIVWSIIIFVCLVFLKSAEDNKDINKSKGLITIEVNGDLKEVDSDNAINILNSLIDKFDKHKEKTDEK